MISVKQAVASAVNFAQNILESPRIANLRLEEVDRGKFRGKDVWLITLSMTGGGPLELGRDYKTFAVDGQKGEVLSMKIRELAGSQ